MNTEIDFKEKASALWCVTIIKNASYLLLSVRPRQWVKNGFVLLPLFFAREIFHFPSLLRSLSAVAIFCLLASAVYLFNDLFDLENDRTHPTKRHRPIAAGLVSPRLAMFTGVIFLLCSLLWGGSLGLGFLLILLSYLAVQMLYNYRLKDVVILDIFCISAGFFLRVIAGAVAIQVDISRWLVICTILISMFLALAKRRHELVILGQSNAANHRKVLSQYSAYLLDQMVGVITASTLLSYMLYCISSETIEKFQTDKLIYTFPFVLYGIFRYLYLIHRKKEGGAPETVLVSDRPLLLSVALWVLLCTLFIYGVI